MLVPLQPDLFIQAVRWIHDHQMGFHQGLENRSVLETRATMADQRHSSIDWYVLAWNWGIYPEKYPEIVLLCDLNLFII